MNQETNPFQSPSAVVERSPDAHESGTDNELSPFARRLLSTACLGCYLSPIWFLASFYVAWLVAWLQLGYQPRPSLDDPKSIGGIATVVYVVSGLVIMLIPALLPMGFAASFYFPRKLSSSKRVVASGFFVVLYLALCTAVVFSLRSDPWDVVEWWFD